MGDYYSGYYWGMNPYSSSDIPGKITDVELRNKIIERINTIDKIGISDIEISVVYGIVTLNGSVRTFQEKRIIAREIWGITGVFKVLNLLKASDPMSAGPRIVVADNSNPLTGNDRNRQ